MVRPEKTIEIDGSTDVLRLVEDVQSSAEGAVLQRDGKPVARLLPVDAKPKSRRRSPKGKPMSFDDPFWKLVGIADSGDGPTDVSSNHHKYVADAIFEHKVGHRDK